MVLRLTLVAADYGQPNVNAAENGMLNLVEVSGFILSFILLAWATFIAVHNCTIVYNSTFFILY